MLKNITKDDLIFPVIAAVGTPAMTSVEAAGYQNDVAAICSTLHDVTEPRIDRDFARLTRRIRRAASSADQSVLLIEYHQRLARYRSAGCVPGVQRGPGVVRCRRRSPWLHHMDLATTRDGCGGVRHRRDDQHVLGRR
jgi:hypothetical protein